jgi:predicted phosphodiesterase
MKRRNFLKNAAIAGVLAAGIERVAASVPVDKNPATHNDQDIILKIGICADLHHDLINDGVQRLQAFINEMKQLKPDFIIQMGDFCVPKPGNKIIIDTWEQFKGPKYHVIGNHDRDGGFTFDDILKFWGAKEAYYSFDKNGYHFVVLNGNERPPDDTSKGYPRSVIKEQRLWMEKDINETSLPVIIFCHQGIDNDMDGIKEGNNLRIVFERINKKAGFTKVQMVFSGHHHEDYYNQYNGINYVQINSISYQFTHPETGYDFAHCIEPIWAVATIYKNGLIKIKGKRSQYETGLSEWKNAADYDANPTVSYISDRTINI